MLDEHVADAGLEFSVDMSTGKNRARFISDVKAEEGSERYTQILESQLQLVAESELRDDADAVRKQVESVSKRASERAPPRASESQIFAS